MNNDYVFIKTVYNIDEYRNILLLLNDNKIKYKLNQNAKSNAVTKSNAIYSNF